MKVVTAIRLSTPSPDGQLIANVDKSGVLIRSCVDNGIVQSFETDKHFTGTWRFARWFIQEKRGASNSRTSDKGDGIAWRFLLADDDYLHVYDADDAQHHIGISNLAGNSGRVADIQFGFTMDLLLIFSDFGSKVILFTIPNQKGLEIRDPKQSSQCYSFRPHTGHLALLTRPALQDLLLLSQHDGSGIAMPVELATVDAQGIQWSPNGQWLAIWDAASIGYKILLLTADGHLFKTYYGGHDADTIGLGVKTLKWSPTGEFLAIGDFDNRVILLKRNTVSRTFSCKSVHV